MVQLPTNTKYEDFGIYVCMLCMYYVSVLYVHISCMHYMCCMYMYYMYVLYAGPYSSQWSENIPQGVRPDPK